MVTMRCGSTARIRRCRRRAPIQNPSTNDQCAGRVTNERGSANVETGRFKVGDAHLECAGKIVDPYKIIERVERRQDDRIEAGCIQELGNMLVRPERSLAVSVNEDDGRHRLGSFLYAESITSAAFSAIMYVALAIKNPGMRGKTDASTTRKPLDAVNSEVAT